MSAKVETKSREKKKHRLNRLQPETVNSSDTFWFGQRYRSTFCSSALKRLQRTHPVSCQHHQIHNISTPYPLNVLIKTKAVFQVSLKKSNLPGVSPRKKNTKQPAEFFDSFTKLKVFGMTKTEAKAFGTSHRSSECHTSKLPTMSAGWMKIRWYVVDGNQKSG